LQAILADISVSMSEFKKNPAAVLRESNNRPVAVLNHNKAAFYMLEPTLYEAIQEEIVDQDLYRKVYARMAEKTKAIEVRLEDL
jgi:antitoxin StbD